MLSFSMKCLLSGLFCASLKAESRDSSINLLPIDPLIPEDIHINQGVDGPVQLNLTFTNSQILGLSKAVAKDFKGFGEDITQKNSLAVKVPGAISLIGDYAVSGKVLILPVQGEGKSNITFLDAEFRVDFTGAPEERDGNTYMKLENFHFYADPKSIIFDFQNLFNGDKALGDNMNKFLNENWKEIFTEIEDSLDKQFRDDSINLPPVDPLTLDTIHIMQGADSPLNIDFTLTNNKLYGLSKAIVTNVNSFGKDLAKEHSVLLKTPDSVTLIADYYAMSVQESVANLVEDEYTNVVRRANIIRGGGFDEITMDDIRKLITDDEINEADLVEMTNEALAIDNSSDNLSKAKIENFSLKSVVKILNLAKELEEYVLDNDSLRDRAEMFKRHLKINLFAYQENYKELRNKGKQTSIKDFFKTNSR
uniref:Uncharacterized protein n=1 Tax=Glossina austeni TaxID=7395 RepID=A0A1A9UNI4_GLOAU